MLPIYVGIHVAFQRELFLNTELIISTFVLDAIRKPADIDKMLAGVGLPHAFYPPPNCPIVRPLLARSKVTAIPSKYVAGCAISIYWLGFRSSAINMFPLKVCNWIKQVCYLLGCVPRFVSMCFVNCKWLFLTLRIWLFLSKYLLIFERHAGAMFGLWTHNCGTVLTNILKRWEMKEDHFFFPFNQWFLRFFALNFRKSRCKVIYWITRVWERERERESK